MTLKEYLDKNWKALIHTKTNRPMMKRVKETICYYAEFDKEERDTENKYNSYEEIESFISTYVDEEREN